MNQNMQNKPLLLIAVLCLFITIPSVLNAGDDVVSVDEIIQMHNDGLNTNVILEHISIIGAVESLSGKDVERLRKHQIPETIIQHAQRLETQKPSGSSNGTPHSSGSGTNQKQPAKQSPASAQPSPQPQQPAAQKKQNRKPAKQNQTRIGFINNGARPVHLSIDRQNKQIWLSAITRKNYIPLEIDGSFYIPYDPGTWTIEIMGIEGGLSFDLKKGKTVKITLVSMDANEIRVGVYQDSLELASGEFKIGDTDGSSSNPSHRPTDYGSTFPNRYEPSSYFHYYRGPYYPGYSNYYYGYPRIYISPGTYYFNRGAYPYRHHRYHRRYGYGLRLSGDFKIGSVKGTYRFGSGYHKRHHFRD